MTTRRNFITGLTSDIDAFAEAVHRAGIESNRKYELKPHVQRRGIKLRAAAFRAKQRRRKRA